MGRETGVGLHGARVGCAEVTLDVPRDWTCRVSVLGPRCFATPDDRAWWGGLWADRMTDSAIARQAVTEGLATEKELREIAEGWRRWATHPDGWYAVLHGEVLCRA
jgi:hypothetical protein